MIVGVGIDLCSVARMSRELERSDGFAASVFTPAEIAAARRRPRPERRFAALFAAKEAVVKAMAGAPSVGMLWGDIELEDAEGTARVTLSGRARAAADSLNIHTVHVSFTHTDERAMACAFASSNPGAAR